MSLINCRNLLRLTLVLPVFSAGIIKRVYIRLIDTNTGVEKNVQTNQLGYYRFDELEAGHTYIIRAESRSFTFTPSDYFLDLMENLGDVDFTAVLQEISSY